MDGKNDTTDATGTEKVNTLKEAMLRIAEAIADGKVVCVDMGCGVWQRIHGIGTYHDSIFGYTLESGMDNASCVSIEGCRVSVIEFSQKEIERIYDPRQLLQHGLSPDEYREAEIIASSFVPPKTVEEFIAYAREVKTILREREGNNCRQK